MDKRELPLLTHLSELRTCLIRAVLGLFLSMIFCYFFADHIMAILRKPMMEIMPQGASFVVLSPQEYFFTELKAAMFFGVIVASPWLFYQIWIFVAPGLYQNEKRMLFWFVVVASLCFVLGIFFAYFLVFPPTFKFFVDTLPPGVNGAYSISMLY
ncbi:MAG TPA: twin-arginine translocase subunit TatC, partial [Myxococcota bacterium]|nr:twin-arginine translocase subunit TatC [Myxococcota bacterium]